MGGQICLSNYCQPPRIQKAIYTSDDYIKLAPFFPLFLACIYLKVKTKDSVKYLFSDQNQILLQQIIFVMEGILLVPVPAELGL